MPSPEADEKLHVSQACLAPGAPKNARATLLLRVGESKEALAVAALREGGTECVSLDLVLDEYTEFTVQGNAQIHLTGYYMPEYAIDGEGDEDDDEEDGANQIIGFDEYGAPVMANEYDSEDDSDYESEDGEEDSEDDFDSDDEDEDELGRRTSSVTIEDITESEQAQNASGKKKALALPAPASANGKKKAEQFSDSDVEGSDEEESDSGSEEESEEEEEGKPAAKPAKGKQTATPAPASAAKGQKRKAEEAPASTATKSAQKAKKEEKKVTKKEVAKKEDDKVAAGQVSSGNKRVRRFANGFEIEDLKMGAADGKLAKPGKKVVVKYVGKLKTGKVFDQTAGNKTFAFRLGVGEVIKGWDRGVEGMRVGDKRRLVVPPQMGYGATRTGPIPPNSELHFDVELVDVK